MSTGQSLSGGAAGIALLRLEQAHTGAAGWDSAHTALLQATAGAVSSAVDTGLFYGAPALSFVLHAARDLPDLRHARETVDTATAAITRTRLAQAHKRIDRHRRPAITEYDLISGLTGLGVTARRSGNHDLLRQILQYLVRLTEPLDGLPGWWTLHSHQRNKPAPAGGHSNHGMAHGITGPLTLLALTHLDGIHVTGQTAAIARICDWLDTWEQHHNGRDRWWPKTITLAELDSATPHQTGPHQPSWCYGTPGITRALHAAARAMDDHLRQQTAEQALSDCLADPAQLGRLTGRTLCHGTGGLLITARRIAADARGHIDLTPALTHHQHTPAPADEPPGFLTGAAGATLAHLATNVTSWDACLLLS
ncbi:Lanthionine synthetase C-like protein [Lentzea xinjiangensis]|uniref:Lanthionine synthetase C-like protein n=1 Tax=Lentzea xinjiangensis TaxID=402600 RepID=A0A1H9W4A2_9PSEU|nr:lanthionine synthetase C family protein [Lentzea xinjiangensis]SES28527.1 Lanthionine synthetase C-like protein [Lentzea xinjiangensis]